MFGLLESSNELTTTIDIINIISNLDVAVFDIENRLIASTQNYIKKKGKNVHATSVQEVIRKGTVVVNHPGTMESCNGCRFKDNCPSSIELLSCININSSAVGVISLTSFNKETHKAVCKSMDKYIELIKNFSHLLSIVISKSTSEAIIQKTGFVNTLINCSKNSVMLIDSNGNILNINENALDFFSSCNFYVQSAYQVLPTKIIVQCLNGIEIHDYHSRIQGLKVSINCNPVINNGKIIGSVIEIIHIEEKARKEEKKEQLEAVDSIIGETKEIKAIKDTIKKVCDSPSTVLITGETGTGKGLIAKTIHMQSLRKNKPFVYVNCAAIPNSLFESELFGYDSGAFTGAKKEGKIGKFELASGGTIFLDEIGDLSIEMQTKLLGVLQEYTFERVGGINPISIDARVIAATDSNIDEMIGEGKFRKELFYRLNVIPIESIPLRYRKDDIPLLVENFITFYNSRLNKHIGGVSEDAMMIIKEYHWEGNIRELMNVIEYSMNICDENVITKESLPRNIIAHYNTRGEGKAKSLLKESEGKLILELLEKYGYDVKGKTKAAEELGITLRSLYRKINKLGISD